jgi:hypothetical protein
MAERFAKMLNPTMDLVEHSTVVAIGVQFMADHWTNLAVVSVAILYVAVHVFLSRVR